MDHLLHPLTPDNPRPVTGPDAPHKTTSARRQAASRANGAKSHGPITPEGKARSSQNAIKHGLLADVLVLEQEDPDVFEEFAAELHDYLRPTNPIARMLVDDLVAAHWRRNRLRRIEAETLNIAIEEHIPSTLDAQYAAALAFRQLTDATATLQLLNRYERGFDRQIVRTLRLLPKWNQPDNSDCETTLVPQSDTPQPSEETPAACEKEASGEAAMNPESEVPSAASVPIQPLLIEHGKRPVPVGRPWRIRTEFRAGEGTDFAVAALADRGPEGIPDHLKPGRGGLFDGARPCVSSVVQAGA